MPIDEILFVLVTLIALAADVMTVLDIWRGWWQENKHDETDDEGV